MDIPKEIINLTDFQLRAGIKEFDSTTIGDGILRTLATKIYGEGNDNIGNMLLLAIPLAFELERRTAIDIEEKEKE